MTLKAVPKSESPIAEQIRMATERAIADGAVAFLAHWETPDKFASACAPDIRALRDGMQRRDWLLHQGVDPDDQED